VPSPAEKSARAVAAWLRPRAEDTDRAALVPRENLECLAEHGLWGVLGPESHGGADLDMATMRSIIRILGGACGATTFVWRQHHGAVRLLADSPNDVLRLRPCPPHAVTRHRDAS
jgi:alkylation response protein AidB-like acyl-CoA dehydrogenase